VPKSLNSERFTTIYMYESPISRLNLKLVVMVILFEFCKELSFCIGKLESRGYRVELFA